MSSPNYLLFHPSDDNDDAKAGLLSDEVRDGIEGAEGLEENMSLWGNFGSRMNREESHRS